MHGCSSAGDYVHAPAFVARTDVRISRSYALVLPSFYNHLTIYTSVYTAVVRISYPPDTLDNCRLDVCSVVAFMSSCVAPLSPPPPPPYSPLRSLFYRFCLSLLPGGSVSPLLSQPLSLLLSLLSLSVIPPNSILFPVPHVPSQKKS